MSIRINVHHTPSEERVFLDPIDCWGAHDGVVFQQYFGGKPQNEYIIGAGHYDRPICIWLNDDSMDPNSPRYFISSESKKDLKSFVDSVRYRHCPDAQVSVVVEI